MISSKMGDGLLLPDLHVDMLVNIRCKSC